MMMKFRYVRVKFLRFKSFATSLKFEIVNANVCAWMGVALVKHI